MKPLKKIADSSLINSGVDAKSAPEDENTIIQVHFPDCDGALGLDFETDSEKMFVIVQNCAPNSPSDLVRPKIEPGMIVCGVNDRDLVGSTFEETMEALRQAERPLTLRFHRPKAVNPREGMTRLQRALSKFKFCSADDYDHHAFRNKASFLSLFEAQVRRRPKQVAVVLNGSTITYAELSRKSALVAANLQKHGVKPNTMVGICISRNIDMYIGLFGILKAGGAYVPLDPVFPKERLSYMIKDAKLSVIITEKKLKPLVQELADGIIETVADLLHSKGANEREDVFIQPHHLAYVIYTSGSTGNPKGVLLEHRSVLNFLGSMQQWPGFSETDTLVAVTTICFDIHVLELYAPLLAGGKVVIASRQVATDGYRLHKLLERHHATKFQATPSTYRLLIEAGWSGSSQMDLLCGGEPLTVNLATQLQPRCRNLYNMYGPTETTVWSAVYHVTPEYLDTKPTCVPIGSPIAETAIYILDPELKQVERGMVGALYIASTVALARGYHNRDDLTRSKFVKDPFAETESLMYCTGDLGRMREDGTFECLGRIDNQVKISGYRIELGEIEAIIDQFETIQASVVVAASDESETKRLVAYLTGSYDLMTLRSFVSKRLPSYMVPTIWMRLDALPLLPNGKVDRSGLPPPNWTSRVSENVVVAEKDKPNTETEHVVHDFVKDLLSLDQLSIVDNFFVLGGNSLFAMRLNSRLKEEFPVKNETIQVSCVFQYPTVKQLAEFIDENVFGLKRESTFEAIVPLQPLGSRPPLFIVHAAGGLVFPYFLLASKFAPQQPVYGIQDPALGDKSKRCKSIEELAGSYVEKMKEIEPTGPYYLAGWSVGGNIAFEMAQQLTKAGDSVATVILLDSYVSEVYSRGEFMYQNLLGGLRNGLVSSSLNHYYDVYKRRMQQENKASLRAAVISLRVCRKLLGTKKHQTIADGPISDGVAEFSTAPRVKNILSMLHHHMKLAQKYTARYYNGRVALIRCKEQAEPDKTDGWMDLCKIGNVTSINGNHYNIVKEPYCTALAQAVQRHIEEAET